MKLHNEAEAAIYTGYSIELLKYFTKYCPKQNESKKLDFVDVNGSRFYDKEKLDEYKVYLNKEWPRKQDGSRHPIPDNIKGDIKAESNHGCAICGHMDNGEVAHIEAYKVGLNNAPENLIFLCPNHHTKFDLGFAPDNNISLEAVQVAKKYKQNARKRLLKFEANASSLLANVISALKNLEDKIKKEEDPHLENVYLTEAQTLVKKLPSIKEEISKSSSKDKLITSTDKLVEDIAPMISRINKNEDYSIKDDLEYVVEKTDELLYELDEVTCPHCNGNGFKGFTNNFCSFCDGDCVVTNDKINEFDKELIDEVTCPRCDGRGQIGLNGHFCKYCDGAKVVSQEEREAYHYSSLDEETCPKCQGTGKKGLSDVICSLCDGAQVISKSEIEKYSLGDDEEIDCPHCHGRGTRGLRSSFCSFCDGAKKVSNEKLEEYNPDGIDEEECPRCGGSGTLGFSDYYCGYYDGDCFVTRDKYNEYDPDELDEEECPRCGGRGTIGYNGSICKLCDGKLVVTKEVANSFDR